MQSMQGGQPARADAEAQRASGGSAWPLSASSALDPQPRLAGGRPSAGTGVHPESTSGAWPCSAGSSRARQGGGGPQLTAVVPEHVECTVGCTSHDGFAWNDMLHFVCYAALEPPKRSACNSPYQRSAFHKAIHVL